MTTTRRDLLRLALGAAAGTGLMGCADTTDAAPVVAGSGTGPASTVPATSSPGVPRSSKVKTPPPAASPAPPIAKVAGNPYGVIPVLMHHRLVDGEVGAYDMTPDHFRAELERLYREKYHPIRAIDLVRRNFATVPPGRTPVVLTFDDGSPGQFAMNGAGRVDPHCAVGILLAFHASYPDFPAVASFYVNKHPFGHSGPVADRALARLHALGCEIGNHTFDHANLRTVSDAQVQSEIGRLAAMVTRAGVPAPRTLALPLGVRPRRRALLIRGGSGRTSYRNEGVLLVGANPSPSPYDRAFDPMQIPRIRCSARDGDLELTYWLDRLAKRPDVRFVATG